MSDCRPGTGEFAQRDAAFGLRADVDDRKVLLDADDLALDDGAFLRAALGEGLFEHCAKSSRDGVAELAAAVAMNSPGMRTAGL